MPRHMQKYPNKFVITLFWMYVLMTEITDKIESKDNKYDIMK